MGAKIENFSYSADVRIELNVNGFVLPLSQIGPDFVTLRTGIDHPPADAEIVMSIDGEVNRWNVHLPEGISSGQSRTRIA
jgi:hypothetical protein